MTRRLRMLLWRRGLGPIGGLWGGRARRPPRWRWRTVVGCRRVGLRTIRFRTIIRRRLIRFWTSGFWTIVGLRRRWTIIPRRRFRRSVVRRGWIRLRTIRFGAVWFRTIVRHWLITRTICWLIAGLVVLLVRGCIGGLVARLISRTVRVWSRGPFCGHDPYRRLIPS